MLELHYERLESSCGPGLPDLLLCRKGKYALVEFKVAKGFRINVAPAQKLWHRRHTKAGGNAWVMWTNGDRIGAFKVAGLPADMQTGKATYHIDEISKIASEAYEITKPFTNRITWLIDLIIGDIK